MSGADSIASWVGSATVAIMLGWYCLSLVFGGALIVHDEIRLCRSAPNAEDVRAYADQVEALHGREAFRLNGEAMYEARKSGDFDRHRFLRAVSSELIRRLISKAEQEQRQC